MGSSDRMFGEEKIGKLLIKFSIPIILSFLISELYSMVDTIFIGRNVGSIGVGALIIVFPIQRIIIALSNMFAIGTSTNFSRANGENNKEKAIEAIENGLSLNMISMIFIMALMYFAGDRVLSLLGASREILPIAREYLNIVLLSSVFLAMTIFISHIMIALGNQRIAIISNIIGVSVNILFNIILVVYLDLGIKGAGISTALSQTMGFIYAYYNYNKLKKKYGIKTRLVLNKKVVLPIILVGISSFIVEAEDGILMGVLNNLLYKSSGDTGIIILGVISKVYMFLFIIMFGIASAMQPIAAYNKGANNYGRLKLIMKKTSIYGFVTSGIVWALAMVFAESLIGLFVQEAEIIRASVLPFRIMIGLFPLISLYYIAIFYFQAMGKAKTSILVAVLRQILLMLPLSIIMVNIFNLGAMGVWLSYPIADLLSSLGAFMLIRNEGLELNMKIQLQKKESQKSNLRLN